mmetsp:Transcript_2777/g.6446  ORF Transcript_2777/g.6446 Transcript_2777/m.6446 type:complete len:722 (+) Transcript_2777:364-2529(+)|eukprot:CAMPEP_0114538112 /NCGR_PEP_ID=MMETSP0109-20121206/29957_1 /TAXON_ID=29199 /ORGANISM="Chlorarachnion reptans, Strain CCCM449" /LENGTH=721 /DNA_ID=CAMNT_0001722085 /DNA_START=352 /DNA_END=2517 /DNA_ORIENTATION=-
MDFNNTGITKDQAEKIWRDLRLNIKEIQNSNASELRFEELYRNSYTLVLHKHGDLLYKGVKNVVAENLQRISSDVSDTVNEKLLKVIVEKWKDHTLHMTMIQDILMYMDKTYCRLEKKEPVYSMGLLLFKEHVIMKSNVANRLKRLLLDSIQEERKGRYVDRLLLKKCTSMLVDVNVRNTDVYKEVFEDDLLTTTAQFYQHESQEFMAQNPVSDYLRKIEKRINEEEERADSYLDKSSYSKIINVVQRELVTKYAQQLVGNKTSGCGYLFTHDRVDDLRRMFRLFSRVPETLQHIRSCMSALVKETGNAIVKDPENLRQPKEFVQKVLDCRRKYDNFVKRAFNQDRQFTRDLKESLEHFINLDSRAARYLSLYLDEMMRKGLKGKSPEEREKLLNDVISIFRYLQDKDVFEDFYKKHLSTRLLTDNSGDREDEKMMISKLKAECGHQFTSRLEGMFNDIKISTDMMNDFRKDLPRRPSASANADINVTVLTTGFWPSSSSEQCNLPVEARQAAEKYERFYAARNSGRRLTWQTHTGTAEIVCHFKKGKKLLAVHTFQMVIIMLFNDADKYTYAEILKKTKIPERDLRRHLLSLAHPKVKVLRKSPNNKTLAPDHMFAWNYDYTSNLYRVKIPLLNVKSETKESKVPPSVIEERKNRVEVVIVRVMKTRKVLDHNSLMSEVMKQSLRFAVKPIFIKKRIEDLIEREFIERDKTNRGVYHYVA